MNYTIEIEEKERTLEFALEVNIWEDRIFGHGRIEFSIEDVGITDNEGNTKIFFCDHELFYLVDEAYKSKIETILEQDDKLFEAWKKHSEEV